MAKIYTNEYNGKQIIHLEQGVDTHTLLKIAEEFFKCKDKLGIHREHYFYEGHAKMLLNFEKSTVEINLIPEIKEWDRPIEEFENEPTSLE